MPVRCFNRTFWYKLICSPFSLSEDNFVVFSTHCSTPTATPDCWGLSHPCLVATDWTDCTLEQEASLSELLRALFCGCTLQTTRSRLSYSPVNQHPMEMCSLALHLPASRFGWNSPIWFKYKLPNPLSVSALTICRPKKPHSHSNKVSKHHILHNFLEHIEQVKWQLPIKYLKVTCDVKDAVLTGGCDGLQMAASDEETFRTSSKVLQL